MFKTLHQRLIGLTLLFILLAMVATACSGDESSANSGLPTEISTSTALPHATITPVAVAAMSEPAPVDWSNVDVFKSAMRPDYADDVEQFANSRRHYIEATIEMNPVATVINGVQLARYTNTYDFPLNSIVFRLVPNTPLTGWRMQVSDLTMEGQSVQPNYEVYDSVMEIPLEQPLQPGESLEFSMRFNLVAERGFSNGIFANTGDIFASPVWYPCFGVYDQDKGWWKGVYANADPYYNETGLFEIKLTHSPDLNVTISGTNIGNEQNSDGTLTEYIVSGPMRDNMIFASPKSGMITDTSDGTTINVVYMPGGERASEWAMEVAKRSLDIFNRTYGDFPYNELDIIEIDLRGQAGGVEFSGAVTIADDVWENGSPQLEGVIAHEIGHQYWYGLVGNNAITKTWLDEALASYSEFVYWRAAYDDNEKRANDSIDGDRNFYNFARSSGGDFPLTTISWNTCDELKNCFLPYTKGPLFYVELEKTYGRELVYQALHVYFEDMHYKIATEADLLRNFEAVIGEDLDAYFYEWIGDFPGLDPAAKAQVDKERSQ
ncbi:MAG: M1 family metallopeptidase [Chloroflexi bacterium]|nr:M1 family metallopeptidase [Chloroflexota bacterium]